MRCREKRPKPAQCPRSSLRCEKQSAMMTRPVLQKCGRKVNASRETDFEALMRCLEEARGTRGGGESRYVSFANRTGFSVEPIQGVVPVT